MNFKIFFKFSKIQYHAIVKVYIEYRFFCGGRFSDFAQPYIWRRSTYSDCMRTFTLAVNGGVSSRGIITSLGSVQVVGFFDVAARLSTGDGPIAELFSGHR